MTGELNPVDAPFDGRWWSEHDATAVVGGRLSIDDGIWTLKLTGWLGGWSQETTIATPPKIIHGTVGTTEVTLSGLVFSWHSGSFFQRPIESRFSVNLILVGAHLREMPLFESARIRFLNLNEWGNRSPWTESQFQSGHGFGENVLIKLPEPLIAEVDCAKVELWRSMHLESGLDKFLAGSDEWLSFEFVTPIALDVIENEFVRPARYLLELAANRRCPLLGFEVVLAGETRPNRSLTVLSSLHRGNLVKPRSSFQLLFDLRSVTFETIIPAWWSLQSRIGVTTDLWATLRESDFLGNRLLNAASSIESYHRHTRESVVTPQHEARLARIYAALTPPDKKWIKRFTTHSHEPILETRIHDLLKEAGTPFADLAESTGFRKWIVDARNGSAHRGPAMKNVDEETILTLRVTTLLQWLVSIVLMGSIGVPHDVYRERIREWGDLDWLLNELRTLRPDWFSTSA